MFHIPPKIDREKLNLTVSQVKKKETKQITVERTSRNKKKFTTTVTGLEHFGIKLKDAATVRATHTGD